MRKLHFALSLSVMILAISALPSYAQNTSGTPADAIVPPAATQQTATVTEVPSAAATTNAPTKVAPADFVPREQEIAPIEQAMLDQIAYIEPPVDIAQIPSLFFSIWEHDLLVDARRGLNTRPAGDDDQVEAVVATGPRDISLGGIVYVSSKDWTIWLNNMRISPGRIPNEIMDLKVYKNHIDLEWFDASTNQIFPIRLRAHQRFNLDARMFLPG